MIQPNQDCCRLLPEGPWYQVAASFIGPPIAWPYEVACRQPYTGEMLVISEDRWENMGMYSLPRRNWIQSEDLDEKTISTAEDYIRRNTKKIAQIAAIGKVVRAAIFGDPI